MYRVIWWAKLPHKFPAAAVELLKFSALDQRFVNN
jgi:hypothetical protein